MRLYKESYTDKNGQRCKSSKWYIDLRDHHSRRRRMPAFTEKRASHALMNNVAALVSCKIAGQRPDAELQRWLEAVPTTLLRKLVSWGLVENRRLEGGRLLCEHLQDWRQSLIAYGCSEAHLKAIIPRVEKIIRECAFSNISDISPVKVEAYLLRLRDQGYTVTLKRIDKETNKPKIKTVKISKSTYNYFIRAIKQFCKWLVDIDLIDKSPVKALKKVTITDDDKKRPARTLTTEQVRKLIQTTSQADDYRRIPGKERALIYLLANETGLRAGEIRQLKISDFDFEKLTLNVRGEVSKNRKSALLPLRKNTAAIVYDHVKQKFPSSEAFNMPAQPHLMIKADLERAGIPYKTEAGTAHFHAQRHNFATALDISAKSAKTAQSLMRHSDPRLTLNVYTHGVPERERAAVEALPDLLEPATKTATGTDDIPLEEVTKKSSAIYSAIFPQKYPDLGQVVTAWPKLSGPVRIALLAMVRAVSDNDNI